MRKVGLFSMVLVLGAGAAFAGSIVVPWFVDNAPAANNIPGVVDGISSAIFLKSNVTESRLCRIAYYNQEGLFLGPTEEEGNSFTIPPNAAVGFRPVAYDPSPEVPDIGQPGGQESELGLSVPDRPVGPQGKKNGSCTITWDGLSTDISGAYKQYHTQLLPNSTQRITMSLSHLLPPGN